MRTPAGKECQYFYGNYFRGREHEECRLLLDASPPLPWNPSLCRTCPVPEILLANACKHMILEPRLERSLPFMKRQVRVVAHCIKSLASDFNPHTGCGQCHLLPPVFSGENRESNSSG